MDKLHRWPLDQPYQLYHRSSTQIRTIQQVNRNPRLSKFWCMVRWFVIPWSLHDCNSSIRCSKERVVLRRIIIEGCALQQSKARSREFLGHRNENWWWLLELKQRDSAYRRKRWNWSSLTQNASDLGKSQRQWEAPQTRRNDDSSVSESNPKELDSELKSQVWREENIALPERHSPDLLDNLIQSIKHIIKLYQLPIKFILLPFNFITCIFGVPSPPTCTSIARRP